MLPPDRRGVPVVQSAPPLHCDIILGYCGASNPLADICQNQLPGCDTWQSLDKELLRNLFTNPSLYTTIEKADMTGHFENFIIFFQDIGHGAFCSCPLYIFVSETGCSCLPLLLPKSCHPDNTDGTFAACHSLESSQ